MHFNRPRTLGLCISLAGVAAGPSTRPSTRPLADWSTSEYGFCRGFRCSHYLHLAVELQQLDPDQRVKRLLEMAADADSMSELLPLCRMLFDRKAGGEWRRPALAGEGFVGGRSPVERGGYVRWPLDPITLQDGIPILVGGRWFAAGGGRPESPAEYLERCLASCRWREMKFADAEPAQIHKAVEAFIAATSDLSADDVTWLRQQAH